MHPQSPTSRCPGIVSRRTPSSAHGVETTGCRTRRQPAPRWPSRLALLAAAGCGWMLLAAPTIIRQAGAQAETDQPAQAESGAQQQNFEERSDLQQSAEERAERQAQRQDQRQDQRRRSERRGDSEQRGEAERRGDWLTLRTDDEHTDDESPALGVVVSSCPGAGVCVQDTVWGSPAEEADIRPGDYILSIDGTEVSSPRELRDVVKKKDPDKRATVVIWRRGQELTKQVYIATEAKELPASERAWLGVLLQDPEEGEEGVRLSRVVPNGPADEAGLRSGDVVLELNGHEVSSVRDFMEHISDSGPGSELKLTIRRGARELTTIAQLGQVDDAPLAYLRQAFSAPFSGPFREGRRATSNESDEKLQSTLEAMQSQIRELREKIEELQKDELQKDELQKEEPKKEEFKIEEIEEEGDRDVKIKETEEEEDGEDHRGSDEPDDRTSASSQLELSQSSPPGLFVMQRGMQGSGQRGNRGADLRFQGNQQRQLYWPQADPLDGTWQQPNWQQPNWQQVPNWRQSNRYGYRYVYPPTTRSPFYGNSYYRYGGRPYYYGNNNNFGNFGGANGIRLSPNFGLYWY